jgi:hypothetical protein
MSTRLAHQGFDKSLTTLRRTLRKLYLTASDRPIARRNARRRVLTALRKMREVVDESFPAIVERAAPRARKTGKARIAALEKAGWVQETPHGATVFAAAGVPIKHVKWKTPAVVFEERKYVQRKGWVQKQRARAVRHEVFLIPAWAAAIGPDKPSELRAAKKSITLRKAALVAEALS